MFKKMFKKVEKKTQDKKSILIAALLIHAAKIDENYAESEKKIIKRALEELNSLSENETEEIMREAEKKEQESNQIIEFTKEIKKKPNGI